MSGHWTYCGFNREDDLEQGDILARTDRLLSILKEYLPYFCNERYTGFIVTTQTCDLVFRKGSSKAEYISLAVIRELEPLLPHLLDAPCGSGIPGVYRKDRRYYAEQLLRRIINQNEQAQGLFYLHPLTADARKLPVLATPSVALLRVTISLRKEHYQLLRESREARLDPVFSAKLGWLVGNLYARPATPDWEDKENDEKASARQCKRLLEFVIAPNGENWVPTSWLEAARGKTDLASISPSQMASTIRPYAPPQPLHVAASRAQVASLDVMLGTAFQDLGTRLRANSIFHHAVVQRLTKIAEETIPRREMREFSAALAHDDNLRGALADYAVSAVKQFALESPNTYVEGATEKLSQIQELPRRTIEELRARLKSEISVDEATLGATCEKFATSLLLPADALEEVAMLARSIQGQVQQAHEIATKIASRLRKDGQFKDAFRSQSELPFISDFD